MPLGFLLYGRGHRLPFTLKLRRLLPCEVSGSPGRLMARSLWIGLFFLRSVSLYSVFSVVNVVYALLRGTEKIPSQNNWLSTALILCREKHDMNADRPRIIAEFFVSNSVTYLNPCRNVPLSGSDKCAA